MSASTFTEARVIGSDVPQTVYMAQRHPRGHPEHVMSRSSLLEFSACPAKWIRGVERIETDEMKWGTLMDVRLTAPTLFAKHYVVSPPTYPVKPTAKDPRTDKPWNRGANFCKAWEEEQLSMAKTPIDRGLFDESDIAFNRAMEEEWLRDVIWASQFQTLITGTFYDKGTDVSVPLKTLLDIIPTGSRKGSVEADAILDFKTCRDASVRRWGKECYERGYHCQAALYLDLFNLANPGRERTSFGHLLQENQPPYQPARRLMSSAFVDLGRDQLMGALRFYCRCIKENKWPSYDEMEPSTFDGWPLTEPAAWMATAAAPYLFSKDNEPDWSRGAGQKEESETPS